jgi:hypothetical protein
MTKRNARIVYRAKGWFTNAHYIALVRICPSVHPTKEV